MQRPEAAEAGPRQVQVERRPGELAGDDEADEESGDTPEYRGDRAEFDRPEIVVGPAVDLLSRQLGRTVVIMINDCERGQQASCSGESSASPIVIDFEPMDASVMSCDFPSLLAASRETRARRRRFEEDQVPQWMARAGPSNGLLHAGRNNPLVCCRKASPRRAA